MKLFASLVLSAIAGHVAGQGIPKGIPKSMELAYAGVAGKFTCLDKSLMIDISQVNDEYCDCADGSDEPGTSACPNARFYCTNKGYRGKYIPSSFVNDGVCDCCDGSDEFSSRAKCANTCDVDGAVWRAAQAEAIKSAEEGARARAAYSQAGQEAARVRKSKLVESQAAADAAKLAVQAAESAVKAAEAEESVLTADKRAALVSSAGSAVATGLGLSGLDRDAAVSFLGEWVRSSGQAGVLEAWLNDKAKEGKMIGVASDGTWTAKLVDPSKPEEAVPDVMTEAGNAAREAATKARAEDSKVSADLSTLQEEGKTDFGPDMAFFKLKGLCLELPDSQYKYSVCPFSRVTQDGTHLGTFSGWKSEGDNPHAAMLFTGGSTCWNGPARSLTLSFKCGASDAIVRVEEPEKCTYSGVMSTPAVCDDRATRALRLSLEPEEEIGRGREEL